MRVAALSRWVILGIRYVLYFSMVRRDKFGEDSVKDLRGLPNLLLVKYCHSFLLYNWGDYLLRGHQEWELLVLTRTPTRQPHQTSITSHHTPYTIHPSRLCMKSASFTLSAAASPIQFTSIHLFHSPMLHRQSLSSSQLSTTDCWHCATYNLWLRHSLAWHETRVSKGKVR